MTNTEQFKQLIEASARILVTSHISPDPDAVSSVLLAGRTLKLNFPDKKVQMALEERPTQDLSFLQGYNDIHFGPVLKETEAFRPDLIIMLDAMNYERVSREDGAKLRQTLSELGSKLVIIDHHTKLGLDKSDLYINGQLPATAQELYSLLLEKLDLQKPDGYAETTLLGIISDSARHKYDNPHHRETYRVVSDLIDAGASIEALEAKLERYTTQEMMVVANLAANMTDSGKGYTYTYTDDHLIDEVDDPASFKMACELFTSQFIRNFENNNWGFVIYPDQVEKRHRTYLVSFRAQSGTVDVSKLAHQLGGGGHKQAAGAKKIEGKTVKEAVKRVQTVIEGSS